MLDNTVTKDFLKVFDLFLQKIKNRENFAFTRFSDGELFILRNETVVLAPSYFVTGDRVGPNIYTEEEQKEFIPDKHQFYREKLMEAFVHNQENYYKGICPIVDVGKAGFEYQLNILGDERQDHLTYASALINRNYRRFIEEMVPLFKDREIIYIVNGLADLSGLPFEVKKDFRIGKNCMVNDYGVAEQVRQYIEENNIKDHIVLCSAASLSNFVIHECFKDNSNNTFLDIGSCLNPLLKLEGWKFTRGYLTHYWLKSNSPYGDLVSHWE